jgi:hypothetical protein
MTSLLSKLFGTATPRVRKSIRRARLGVECLDGRIMPMTMVELQTIIGPPVAPKVATPPEASVQAGGQMEVSIFGNGSGRAQGWIR